MATTQANSDHWLIGPEGFTRVQGSGKQVANYCFWAFAGWIKWASRQPEPTMPASRFHLAAAARWWGRANGDHKSGYFNMDHYQKYLQATIK